jgi:hypothetical protein
LAVGGVTAGFSVTTIPDTLPDSFAIAARADVPVSSDVDSSPVIITGIDVPVSISVVGGEYSINGGTFSTQLG